MKSPNSLTKIKETFVLEIQIIETLLSSKVFEF